MKVKTSEIREIIKEEMRKQSKTAVPARKKAQAPRRRPATKSSLAESRRRARIDSWLDREIAKEERLKESKSRGCGCNDTKTRRRR